MLKKKSIQNVLFGKNALVLEELPIFAFFFPEKVKKIQCGLSGHTVVIHTNL